MRNIKVSWNIILGVLFLIAIVLKIIYYTYLLGHDEKIIKLKETSNYIVWGTIILFVITQVNKTKEK